MWEFSGSIVATDIYDETSAYPYYADTQAGYGLIGYIGSIYIWSWAKA
jgi:hypothetical protein